MKIKMEEIVQATGGTLVKGLPRDEVTGVSTDSRTIKKGELFVALRGPHFDGHRFVGPAVRRGAAGIMVDRAGRFPARDVVRVKDTLRGLGDLAGSWRRRFDIPVVAVTGSNGKTTTKEMIAAVLSSRLRVLKTEGNLNNQIGLPLTLLKLTSGTDVAVVELGVNVEGEIGRLSEIASPDVGVITNIGRAHLEGLKGIAGVAREKGALLTHLKGQSGGGLAVLNGDDRFGDRLSRRSRAPVTRFGLGRSNEVRATSVRLDGLAGSFFQVNLDGRPVRFHLVTPGVAGVRNALAAIAVGRHFGIPVSSLRRALKGFRGEGHRMQVIRLARSVDLIDDSYNANPDSMSVALQLLKEAGRRRRGLVAVLGEMLELGKAAPRAHREVGRLAGEAGLRLLFVVGSRAGEIGRGARQAGMAANRIFLFSNTEQAARSVATFLRRGDLVLVKGSHGVHLERVVEALLRRCS